MSQVIGNIHGNTDIELPPINPKSIMIAFKIENTLHNIK